MDATPIFDLTPLLDAVVTAMLIFTTKLLWPWIKSKASDAQLAALNRLLDTLVRAAEQVFGDNEGALKLQQVQDWLADRGQNVDLPTIEAAVYRMNNEGAGASPQVLLTLENPEVEVGNG
jgi:hypothetical protein